MVFAYAIRLAAAVGLFCAVVPAAPAMEVSNYSFPSAAQEITQLFWLAETANVCGWSSLQDVVKFKRFTMRFLGAHLSDRHREALASMVRGQGYEEQVRQAAEEGAAENCRSNRWHLGWVSYKSAADENEGVY